jgi:hypothetical protein
MHNDGRPVSPDKLKETLEEIIAEFGALSLAPHTMQGIWVHDGTRYDEQSRLLIVDVDDTPENQQFFVEWKSALLQRFEQIEIYIVSYVVDRV